MSEIPVLPSSEGIMTIRAKARTVINYLYYEARAYRYRTGTVNKERILARIKEARDLWATGKLGRGPWAEARTPKYYPPEEYTSHGLWTPENSTFEEWFLHNIGMRLSDVWEHDEVRVTLRIPERLAARISRFHKQRGRGCSYDRTLLILLTKGLRHKD